MRVALVDYIGYEDQKGVPVGHPLKVMRELRDLLDGEAEIEILAPASYLKALGEDDGKALPLAVNALKSGKNVVENIKCMFISFVNIHRALRRATADVLWFCNIDQFLFMFLGMFGFHGKKIVITLFAQHYHKWYHDYFMKKVLPRVSFIVSTNPEADLTGFRKVSQPDYLYKKERYAPYRPEKKQEKVVCLGTMNRSKQIKELVEIWKDIPYPLEIYGLFYEEAYYQEIMAQKKDTIKIENRYLEYDEYLQILGEAKFSVLPYKQAAYEQFTSGVILESVFVGTIPVTCEMLIKRMKLNGISYSELKQLKEVDFTDRSWEALAAKNDQYAESALSEERYRDEILALLEKIGAEGNR